ncbi:MAG: DUF616 domain-containing protein [Lachnospiraceae bacterium]|nr:DUF616 domain-containing protein [Lachnospiraceae bacterium]
MLSFNDKKLVIYGAGKGGILIAGLLKCFDISIECFVDNDPEKRFKMVFDDVTCCLPEDITAKTSCCVIPGISEKNKEVLIKRIREDGFTCIVELADYLDDQLQEDREGLQKAFQFLYESERLDIFSKLSKKKYSLKRALNRKLGEYGKIAVYTALFGDYDDLYQPAFIDPQLDYYIISDKKPESSGGFVWINAKDLLSDSISSPILRNRYFKMHPHKIFPQYDHSIYIDSNIEILRDIRSYIPDAESGISVFQHHGRDCIFYEALQIVDLKRVFWKEVYEQMKRYLDEGMPLHYGLGEMNVIGRRHNDPTCMKIMEQWWEEFNRGALRDQFSFMYVLWKNGYDMDDLDILGYDNREYDDFRIHPHRS